MDFKTKSDLIGNLAQTAAFVGAAGFFVWKAWAGYSTINMSLDVKPSRVHVAGGSNDYLVVAIELVKGDRATLSLNEISMKVSPDPIEGKQVTLFEEVTVSDGKDQRPLHLTPGETTRFERVLTVDKSKVYTIDVTVRGEA